jgi:nitroreductase
MGDNDVATGVVENAVRLACRAPSLHNTQPWHWVVDDDAVRLFLERDRVLHATDHSGRAALLGCGAVLDHFRVAMAAAGWTAAVDRLPDPADPLLLASIDFTASELITDGDHRRADAILHRRTDRLPFDEPPGWDLAEANLQRAVTAEAVRLDVVPDEFRSVLAEASKLTASLRMYDRSYHDELAWWTQVFNSSEGIPQSALVSTDEGDRVDVGRRFPVAADSNRCVGLGHDRSKIVVLSTYDNQRASVLQCGETLSSVLLEATMAGLATCTLTHITELRASRNIVAAVIDQTTTPQALIRVGAALQVRDVPPPTPRRPINDVFEVRSAAGRRNGVRGRYSP